jgi:hypothetical protein
MQTQRKLNELRHERRTNSLSLGDVARFYRGGRTRERIRAIESSKTVSPEVKCDYLAAITAAVADLKQKGELLTRMRAEMAK